MSRPEPTRASPPPTQRPDELTPTGMPSDAGTAGAPPFVAPAPRGTAPGPFVGFPEAGETMSDFELLRVLGSGAFARVYLARQKSLGRLVALKVSRVQGREAQTLARLEHPHVVAVYSEDRVPARDLHLLCMQYVPGTTLESVLVALQSVPPGRRDGRAILDALDAKAVDDTALDLAALRDRERLAAMDAVEAACWIAARLAEALAHAHDQQILHRDIKPANVLLNRYGRPLLADFNVAQTADDGPSFGGTLPYMAPEHLEAFNREGRDPVDARSDVYSLGLVIYELYTGRWAFGMADGPPREAVRVMARERRGGAPSLGSAPAPLERVVARCLAASPAARFATAAELAAELDAVRELHRVRRDLPEPKTLTRWGLASPFWYASLLIPLPHLLGSVVNFAYNTTRIQLEGEHVDAFVWVALVYNVLAYPGCLYVFFRQLTPVFRTWGELNRGGRPDPAVVDQMRLAALTLPGWLAGLSCLGWLPGGVFFPAGLTLLAGPVEPIVWVQFLVSFTLSGLIAITYSAMLMELLVVRVLYPGLFLDARGLHEKARQELRHEEGRLGLVQLLAVLIPLAGAGLLVGLGPEDQFTQSSYRAFRVLVTGLLAAGMLGLGLAVYAAAEVRDAVGRLTGGAR